MNIVTHVNPDFDAIASVWLLQRFGGFENAAVKFVNTGNPDATLLADASAVVDTGKAYDEMNFRFDHHHLPGQTANDTCAAMQVYLYLLSRDSTIEYLRPLIALIFAGDTGRSEANASRELGIHALLSAFKSTRPSDQAIMDYGFGLLDTLALRLQNQAITKAELAEKIIFKSRDNKVWAIRYGSSGSSFAAFDEGARVVVFEGEPIEVEGGTTYPIGLMRAGEWNEPHCGELVKAIRQWNTDGLNDAILDAELSRFFRHPAGFFAGRGTAKAPVFEPILISLEMLAQIVDRVWSR